jgi:hypothetical protein
MDTSRNLALRDCKPGTALRSIRGGQACCSALSHRRAASHRVARASPEAAQRATRYIKQISEERASTRRRERKGRYEVAGHPTAYPLRVDSPAKRIYRGVHHG